MYGICHSNNEFNETYAPLWVEWDIKSINDSRGCCIPMGNLSLMSLQLISNDPNDGITITYGNTHCISGIPPRKFNEQNVSCLNAPQFCVCLLCCVVLYFCIWRSLVCSLLFMYACFVFCFVVFLECVLRKFAIFDIFWHFFFFSVFSLNVWQNMMPS